MKFLFNRIVAMTEFLGPKHTALLVVFGWIAFAAETVILPIPAHADANSYLAYLAAHGTNTSLWPDTRKVDSGERLCGMLHSGMSPGQILGSSGFHVVDAVGILDAAQHELCPDTLGR